MSGGEKAGEMNHCWTGIVGRPVICIWLKCYSNVNQQLGSLKKKYVTPFKNNFFLTGKELHEDATY